MSRWGEFRKCSGCMYMNEAETETGFGCYQDKRGIYEVTPERPGCSCWNPDVRQNFVPVGFGDVWDDPLYRRA